MPSALVPSALQKQHTFERFRKMPLGILRTIAAQTVAGPVPASLAHLIWGSQRVACANQACPPALFSGDADALHFVNLPAASEDFDRLQLWARARLCGKG